MTCVRSTVHVQPLDALVVNRAQEPGNVVLVAEF